VESPPSRSSTAKRAVRALLAIAIVALLYARCGPRPDFLPLATRIDGPAPARAAGVVVFLHGRGGSLSRAEPLVKQLRDAGLPPDFAIVLVEAPYSTGLGHQWGRSAEAQATARARLRTLLRELLGDGGPPRERVIVAGFSQGAGLAIDTAVEEPRVGALVALATAP
jgi:pimeloyl-ACP methyl ester carboxylesterase